MPATSTLLDQAHNAIERKLFCHERLPSSWWQPTGVSDGAGPLIQPRAVSATSQARGPVWGASGRRTRTDTRLVPEPPDPHLGRLSLSGGILHHIIRWNVDFEALPETTETWIRIAMIHLM